MAKNELNVAIEQICDEKNIPYNSVVESIEAALAVAYRKEFGNKLLNCRVEFNPDDGSSVIYDVKTVVEDPTAEELQEAAARQEERKAGAREKQGEAEPERKAKKDNVTKEEKEEEEKKRFNPRTDVAISAARQIKPDAELGDEIITELPVPSGYGRVAAQTAKQVIIQKLREAERETLYTQYKDRVGEVVNATVQRVEGPMVYMDLGQAVAIMPPAHQVPNERYQIGARYKVYLLSVEKTNKGPEIIASRAASDIVRALFAMEVPEISSGSIEIKSVAREVGSRSKIAVISLVSNIDPIGSCVGQRGARVQTVMNELGGEKIDIIEYSDDPVKFIVNALSPAKIVSVQLHEAEKTAVAHVVEDQLSLAIGKGGQNVRLAAKLAGWRIDVVKYEPVESSVADEAVENVEKQQADQKADQQKENGKEEQKDQEQTMEKKSTSNTVEVAAKEEVNEKKKNKSETKSKSSASAATEQSGEQDKISK